MSREVGGSSSRSTSPYGSMTKLKYEKSSCYFCNEWFDSSSFKEHLIHCGQVLEKCPNKCSAFVQRVKMRSHLKECPNSGSKTSLNQNGSSEDIQQNCDYEYRINILEQDLNNMRSVLNEEIRQRLHLITDVGSLRKHNQVTDDWQEDITHMFDKLNIKVSEEAVKHLTDFETCQNEIRYCYDLSQSLKKDLERDRDHLRKQLGEVSFEMDQTVCNISENLVKLENNLHVMDSAVTNKFAILGEAIDDIEKRMTTTRQGPNEEFLLKQGTLDYEVKSMKGFVCEIEEKCIKMDQTIYQVTKELQDIHSHYKYYHRMASIVNNNGHMIWRLSKYTEKLADAKLYDSVIHSPLFLNKPFGYTLRLDVHLNGKGTFKGRNIIACVNVLRGEYDPLLQWPCRLKADLIIRDQADKLENAVDFSKVVFIKRKNDDFTTNQYFHIPHKLLESRDYLKDDAIFFEIRVQKNKV